MNNPFISMLARRQTKLRQKLRMARMHITAETYLQRVLVLATLAAVGMGFLLFVVLDAVRGRPLAGQNFMVSFLFGVIAWIATAMFLMREVDVRIRQHERELNRDVVFIGRYMLVKLQSGEPFYQALIDASRGGFGTASSYVREIVDDIELGTPIENALGKAAELSPSNEFRQILWQINAALRSGVDVSETLKSIIREMEGEQIIEVERYGKKLSSLSLIYMLGAIILPSLGLTLFVSFSGFLGIQISFVHLVIVLFFTIMLQFMFMSIFRSIRPDVNL